MRRARFARELARVALALGAAGATGCTHNHYYTGLPPCGDATATTIGSVCEVPPAQGVIVQGGPPAVVRTGPGRPPVVSAARPSRSATVGGTTIESTPARPGSRFSWRGSDPENIARTRVNGALNEEDTIER